VASEPGAAAPRYFVPVFAHIQEVLPQKGLRCDDAPIGEFDLIRRSGYRRRRRTQADEILGRRNSEPARCNLKRRCRPRSGIVDGAISDELGIGERLYRGD